MVCRYPCVETRALPGSSQVVIIIVLNSVNYRVSKINFTFLNVNNFRTNMRIATPAIYIDRGDL